MSEEQEFSFNLFVRKWSWKLLGALFMRNKGENGTENQAISSHKLFGLICFAFASYIWMLGGNELSNDEMLKILEQGGTLPSRWGEVPDVLIYSVWAFLGVDVAKNMLEVVKHLKR